jgi:two-component system NtrC family response regulator
VVPANILVIDDERVICDGCRLALSEQGHAVDVSLEGKAGLDAVLKVGYDILLLDMKLPDTNGMEILRAVHEAKPRLNVIVMTGYSTVQNAVEAMKKGAFDYLAKPFTEDELLLSVERALENKRLVEENLALRQQLYERSDFDSIVGEHSTILHIFDEIKRVAPTESTVLLEGESGTGKELFARAIHAHSKRATRQFVAVDCSTFSPGLLESELFGHVKGAFTGADRDKAGIFQAADGGTLFLDEIGNLNFKTQGKLLRVMETHEFKPVGASRPKRTDLRIISATNRDLKAMVEAGDFREDLFYRLNVLPIFLPPLRERKSDIPLLAYHFLKFFCRKMGKRIEGISDDALEVLVNQEWPGNVRQLKNTIERLVIMTDRKYVDFFYLLDQLSLHKGRPGDGVPETLEELKAVKRHLLQERFGRAEKAFLLKALRECNGNVSHAAKKVGMRRPNFHALMRKHKLSADGFREGR